jgi:hypothetical protein
VAREKIRSIGNMKENMDYLKCPEKLGWNKAKSCK